MSAPAPAPSAERGSGLRRGLLEPTDAVLNSRSLDELAALEAVRASGLTGRGGAGFPVARKLAAARDAGRRPIIVGNGAEGEPLSSKDAVLLARNPDLVIDGLLAAARIVGSRRPALVVKAAARDDVERALARRADARDVTVHVAPDAFTSGEASAAAALVAGRDPIPADRVVPLAVRGPGGRPTLVQNVETLAHLALVLRHGPDVFRAAGDPADPGTRLSTLAGDVALPGVVEAPTGASAVELLARARTDAAGIRAVLVGGYHGAWLPGDALGTPLTRSALAPFGASPGAGVVLALARGVCPLVVAASIVSWLASQSAGQCGPCVNGLPAMARTLASLAERRREPGLVDEVRRYAALVTGRGACHHPDGTARLVLSTLSVFHRDVDAHLTGGCCESTGRVAPRSHAGEER